MTNEFSVKKNYDNNKPSFQSIMNKIYKDYLKINLEKITLDNKKSYNDTDKIFFTDVQ